MQINQSLDPSIDHHKHNTNTWEFIPEIVIKHVPMVDMPQLLQELDRLEHGWLVGLD